jgi:probable HAF family extracellular repeat protein
VPWGRLDGEADSFEPANEFANRPFSTTRILAQRGEAGVRYFQATDLSAAADGVTRSRRTLSCGGAMRRLWFILVGFILALALVGCAGGDEATTTTTSEATSGSRWLITDLGTLPGDDRSYTVAINERGQIIGWSGAAPASPWDGHAFLWKGNGQIVDLGTLPDSQGCKALALNDRGQVVGYCWETLAENDLPLRRHAFLWRNGKMVDLGTLPGKKECQAEAVNERGQVVGYCWTKPRQYTSRAFLWRSGKMLDLGTLGGDASYAYAINERGQVIGDSTTADEREHAFVWEGGEMTDLGTLARLDVSTAAAMSERGQIVGWSADGGWPHGFLWHMGTMIDLGRRAYPYAINERGQIVGERLVPFRHNPAGGSYLAFRREGRKTIDLALGGRRSAAVAINERGEVVGFSATGSGGTHAFVWSGGKMVDLGTLGGRDSCTPSANLYRLCSGDPVDAINGRGQIIGWSRTTSGKQHAVLWTLKR